MAHPEIQALLGPLPPSEFFATYWNRKPVVLRPAELPEPFRVEVDDVLGWYLQEAPTDTSFATFNLIRQSRADGRQRLRRLQDEGDWSRQSLLTLAAQEALVIRDLTRRDRFKPYVQSQEMLWRARVTLNCYLLMPNSDRFPLHQDGHHIFAVQSAGTKGWLLWPPTVELPMSRYRWRKEESPEGEALEIKVNAGEILYIPTGWLHYTTNPSRESLHFSLGVHPPRWIHLLERLLDHAGSRHAILREYLPFRVSPDGVSYEAPDAADVRRLLQMVADELEPLLATAVDGLNTGEKASPTVDPMASGQGPSKE